MEAENPGPAFTLLPEELVRSILEHLDHRDLFRVAQTSQWGYNSAIPLLWKDLELKDCWTLHPRHCRTQRASERGQDSLADEHDDTPIIKKLVVLATNRFIASQVQTVLHRCHLPTPGIYHELPLFCFRSATLSQDPRTHRLLQLAIWNMTNVQTLRIVFGHYYLSYGLIWGFLHPERPKDIPLRRLWLESCSLALPRPGGPYNWPDLTGLESVRIRRLSYLDDSVRGSVPFNGIALGRGTGRRKMLQNGVGGEYSTTIERMLPDGSVLATANSTSTNDAKKFDDIIYDYLIEATVFLSVRHDPAEQHRLDITKATTPVLFLKNLFLEGSSSLTSLNLDMLLTYSCYQDRDESDIHDLLNHLSVLRFPSLRAFQMRNVMTPWTSLPRGTYLLDRPEFSEDGSTVSTSFLDFMEAHQNLKCLAWPMVRFFSHRRSGDAISARQDRIIMNLARTLVELRVDTSFADDPDDEVPGFFHSAPGATARRRRFITQFASRMTKVEHLKMEGGIPRDEKRETIRALWKCPLNKIVMIANSCPIGNAWGNADSFRSSMSGADDWGLEDEDLNALKQTVEKAPVPPGRDFEFQAEFGWLPTSLMTHEIAAFHAEGVTELKFCGYTGAPILYTPTELAHPLLSPVQYFHNLEKLTMSMWMDTNYEGRYRDDEVIAYWINAREPTSTALTVVMDTDSESESDEEMVDGPTAPPSAVPQASSALPDQEQQQQQNAATATPAGQANIQTLVAVTGDPVTGPEPVIASSRPMSWSRRLRTQYAPHAIAGQIAAQLGPYISEKAKERRGGVTVRASFCLGHHAGTGTVFDIDVAVGKGDQVLRYEGPREEGERGRWWGKLKARRWF